MASLLDDYRSLPLLGRFLVRLVFITIPALVLCYFLFWDGDDEGSRAVDSTQTPKVEDTRDAQTVDPAPEYAAKALNRDIVFSINRYMKQNQLPQRATSADCEAMEVVEKNAISDCMVKYKGGYEEYIRVTMQDDQGHFTFEPM